MLIAAERRNRDGPPEDGRIEHADHARCIRHARQHGAGNVQRFEQRVVPIVLADVKEHRPARVGRVRHMRPPADEVPRQKAVHRAEAAFNAPHHLLHGAAVGNVGLHAHHAAALVLQRRLQRKRLVAALYIVYAHGPAAARKQRGRRRAYAP